MALSSRNSGRFSAAIWPGFVDAMTALLLVLMFVLTIFMVVQSVLRDTISTQDTELDAFSRQVADLADALGLEKARAAELELNLAGLNADLAEAGRAAEAQSTLIATLNSRLEGQSAELAAAEGKITDFEAQVASLLLQRDTARADAAQLTDTRDKLLSDQAALQTLLAELENRTDAEKADLAGQIATLVAERDALSRQVVALEGEKAALTGKVAAIDTELSEAERLRLAEAAAAEALRARLQSADTELTAMTLALEEQRKRAEDTLTLLAAAKAARDALDVERSATLDQLSEAEKRAALLAVAQSALANEQALSAEAARKVALLNEQIAALRGQLGALQEIVDASATQDREDKVQIDALGSQLNSALARVAAEQKRRAELEAAERARLEEEAKQLAEEAKQLSRYRSEFFGKLSEVLAGREGVRVVGDRFVFSSEVLFEPGSADLAVEGRAQIAGVVATLSEVAAQIPPEIDWVIRVDGHTDNMPLSGSGLYRDNWELSQARALAVVRFMQNELGFPPEHLAAAGFGEYRPVAEGDTPEARALNRRIEMKLTEH